LLDIQSNDKKFPFYATFLPVDGITIRVILNYETRS
jgi:hypothetical protein